MNRLPDIPYDTFAGLDSSLSDLLKRDIDTPDNNIDNLNSLSSLISNVNNLSALSKNLFNFTTNPATSQNTGENPMAQAPSYDGWTLPKGTVRGILKPFPTYQVGTGPTMASMNYTTPLPDYVKPGFAVPKEYEPYIQEAAQLYHLDPNLIKAIIKQESNFNPKAKSPVGAVGLMQLMPATAADAGISDAERYDPRMNILAASRYIRHIYDNYQNWPLTLAAYNGGPNHKIIRSGRIWNVEETRNYVRRVMAYWGMGW